MKRVVEAAMRCLEMCKGKRGQLLFVDLDDTLVKTTELLMRLGLWNSPPESSQEVIDRYLDAGPVLLDAEVNDPVLDYVKRKKSSTLATFVLTARVSVPVQLTLAQVEKLLPSTMLLVNTNKGEVINSIVHYFGHKRVTKLTIIDDKLEQYSGLEDYPFNVEMLHPQEVIV